MAHSITRTLTLFLAAALLMGTVAVAKNLKPSAGFVRAAPAKPVAQAPAAAAGGWTAEFGGGSGEVTFDAIGRPSMLKIHGVGKGPKGKATIHQDLFSGEFTFELDSLDTKVEMRNRHMKEKYLETAKFPVAKLVIRPSPIKPGFGSSGFSEAADFEGTLSLHGETHPLGGKLQIKTESGKLQLIGNFELKISGFNIPTPGYAGITMAEDVKVQATAEGVLGRSR